jgi:predicted secreted protein
MNTNLTRRTLLKAGALLPLALTATPLFAARKKKTLVHKIKLSSQTEKQITELFPDAVEHIHWTNMISIEAPFIAENQYMIPAKVNIKEPVEGFLALLVNENPYPLVLHMPLGKEYSAPVSARMRSLSARTRIDILAVVESNGMLYANALEVKVSRCGCMGG